MPRPSSTLLLLIIAIATSLLLFSHSTPKRADLEIWAFSEESANAYRSLALLYTARTHQTISVKLLSPRAIDTRLESLFLSNSADSLPDIVSIEINSVGKFFRPPAAEVGFLPLESLLPPNTFLPARLTPFTKSSHLFGLPDDLHPVTLTYRADLFSQAHIDLSSIHTWPEFQSACLSYQSFQQSHGHPERFATDFPSSAIDALYILLLQQHLDLLDPSDHSNLNNPKVAATLSFYAQLVAGERKISADPGPSPAARARQLATGLIAATLTPDWRIPSLHDWAPDLAGKLAMIPLPTFNPTDSPTSTWGGTMLAIPRHVHNPQAAWNLLHFLTLSPEALAARPLYSQPLSPSPAAWTNPLLLQPDPLFITPPTPLFIRLAPSVPPRTLSFSTPIAAGELSLVLHRAVSHLNSTHSPTTLDPLITQWLSTASSDLNHYMNFAKVQ